MRRPLTLEIRTETPCREEGFGQGCRREQSEGPNLPEPRGPGIGGGVDDTGNQGAASPGTGGGFSRRAGVPALAATRVRLATVAARYSWNRVLARPK